MDQTYQIGDVIQWYNKHNHVCVGVVTDMRWSDYLETLLYFVKDNDDTTHVAMAKDVRGQKIPN